MSGQQGGVIGMQLPVGPQHILCTPSTVFKAPEPQDRPRIDNLTAVLYGREDLRLEQRPVPVPKDDEVLLAVECVGVCGSDIHSVVHGPTGDRPSLILGHEATGTVVCAGRQATCFRRGDRVAVEQAGPCSMCKFCELGCYELCNAHSLYGCGPRPGCLARFYAHLAAYCHPLPAHVTLEEGAMVEPLAIAVHACRRGRVGPGSRMLVTGAGSVGLLCVQVAKALGACQVAVVDHLVHRLDAARQLGADYTVLVVDGCHCDKNIADTVHALLRSEPHVTIECWGTELGARVAILTTSPGGCVVFVGMSPPSVRIPLTEACSKEIVLRSVSRTRADFSFAMWLVTTRQVNVSRLITHRFSLEETQRAVAATRDGLSRPLKVMVHCRPPPAPAPAPAATTGLPGSFPATASAPPQS